MQSFLIFPNKKCWSKSTLLSIHQLALCLSLYFNFVAIPPLICLSALFSSKILLTSAAKALLICTNLSLTSLCTVVTFRNGRIYYGRKIVRFFCSNKVKLPWFVQLRSNLHIGRSRFSYIFKICNYCRLTSNFI